MTTPPQRSSQDTADGDGGSLLRASALMTLVAVLLSWLPVLGPLIAGVVGGREAETPPRAIGAALLPALVLGVVVGLVLAAFDLPVIGAVAGLGVFVAVVVQLAPLLLGAWFGAATGQDVRV